METVLRSVLLDPALAQRGRRDTVEQRGLVQTDEGVGLQPMPADTVSTVDERHPHIGVVGHRVGESHSHSTGSHDEVVGLDAARHPPTMALRC